MKHGDEDKSEVHVGSIPKVSSLVASKDKERKYFEPDEWYKAEFEKAETGKGQFGPWIKFTFRVLDGVTESGESAKGLTATEMMNAELTPSQKLWKWIKVFFDKEPEVGKNYDITTFYGERFRILIKDKESKKKDAARYQRIDAIKRLKKAGD
jgi:hypothetical protein